MVIARALPDGPVTAKTPQQRLSYKNDDTLYFSAQTCVAHPMVIARALPDSFETPSTIKNDVDIKM
eukprot:7602139-Heterocapsa_arctica.AAC.1